MARPHLCGDPIQADPGSQRVPTTAGRAALRGHHAVGFTCGDPVALLSGRADL